MSWMCYAAYLYHVDVSSCQTRKFTSMAVAFHHAKVFNNGISKRNTPAVTQMDAMFSGAKVFNGEFSEWNVINVTTMTHMLSASIFNGGISNWNVNKVTLRFSMFANAIPFDQHLCWDLSGKTQLLCSIILKEVPDLIKILCFFPCYNFMMCCGI